MNPPLAKKLATMLGVSLPTDAADAIVRELQKACLAGSLAEREACAQVAENCFEGVGKHKPIIMAVEAAKAIRARGQA